MGQTSKATFKHLGPFIGTYTIFWLLGTIYWVWWGYESSFLLLNEQRATWADLFFPHYTHLGDGVIIPAILGLILIRKKTPFVLNMLFSLLILLIVMWVFKKVVFQGWDRPLMVFEGKTYIHYVSTRVLRYNSFPSGHSAAAGAVFTFVALILPRSFSRLGILAAILSIGVAYSRVYIGVHFLGDIVVGSLIGVVLAMGLTIWLYPGFQRFYNNLRSGTRIWYQAGLYLLVLFLLGSQLLHLSEFYMQ